MKLYKAQTPPAHLSKLTENDFIHSYQREFEWTSDTIRTDLWAVSMPSSSPSRDREWYVLAELLSGASIFAMSGRAAMIWKAVKLHDPSGKIYILKQSWRVIEDETNLESGNIDILSTVNNHRNIHEGRLWKLGLQDTELESFEDVRIGNKNVTIASYCRKGLEYIPHQVPSSRQSETHSEGNDKSRPLDLPTPDDRQHDQSPIPVQNRSLSRTCLRSPGIPIRMFTTVAELLKFFKDAIQQHKDLYMAGVLHSDVSLGNLIICPQFDEDTKTYTWEDAQGKLIDLDHAKYTQKWKTLTPNDTSASGYKERWERMAGALRVTLADEPHFQYLDIESMSERAYAWYVGRVANDYATLQAMTLSPALELQLDLGRRPNFEPNSLDKSDSHTLWVI
ncbi:hypothetical protein CVT25_001733 [Psilocybe cyanescens]|uniref:Fungal-type protein kinase domain-containing protein n=1 Tax=Psilocybe cyanescens TaxID=93625 RepID=A0A409WPL2_PSICY|nr:hypothetical protein CVT25_001733 [Psilocybe cyanescens]